MGPSRSDRNDPRPLLALVACLIAYWLYRFASRIHPGQLSHLIPRASALPIALGATAIATALATQRLIATRRTLRSRRAVAVVPADEFDPRPEAIASFAAQLGRSQRFLGGWLDRRASALRVRLTTDAEGRFAYLLEVPERSAALLRSALRAYRGIELRNPEEVLGRDEPPSGEAVRAELVLAEPSVEPLARLGPDPDPLGAFAAATSSLSVEAGERAEVCLDLLPARGSRAARLRRRLKRQARRCGEPGLGLSELLGGDRESRGRSPDQLFERRHTGQGLDVKLRETATLFEAQILLRTLAPRRPRAKALMGGLLAAIEPTAERNHLRVAGFGIPGLLFVGADVPLRRGRFDRRLRSGLFRPARRNVLTTSELAGFLKPPTVHCHLEEVLRAGALLSLPPPLSDFDSRDPELIPLGRVSSETGERLVAVRSAESFFIYLSGRSRFGKSELAVAMFTSLVRSGHGGLFLDPHGDALSRVRPYLSDPRVAGRVVEIDLRSASAAQPGWNLFELRGASAEEREARVAAVTDAFASAMRWTERSTRAINLTSQAAAALAAIAAVLPAELAPTVFQIPTLLTNERWRSAVLPFLPASSRSFWLDRFPRLSEEAVTPVSNAIDRLRASTAASTLLGQSVGSYRVREAMERGQIVLVCPGAGGTLSRLVANLIVFDLFHSARARGERPAGERRPFFACLDEIQTFEGGAADLAGLIEQTAKFGLRGIFISQNPERLSAPTLDALLTNRSHLITSALDSHAAALISREWGGEPSPAAIGRLARYRFIGQVTQGGELSRPFALGGIRVEDALGPSAGPESLADLDRLSAEATARCSPPEALEHLEHLDERILAALKALRGEAGASSPVTGSLGVKRKKGAIG
jgi:hypothetical protein